MKKDSKSELIQICVVIPAFKVKTQVLDVLKSIGSEVEKIIVVDDACPEKSGEYVKANFQDPRLEVIFLKKNLGVGGAVKAGYARALEINAQVIVKVDGDGQMDTSKIIELTKPISEKQADYTKGNRFFNIAAIQQMPKMRIVGNLALSFLTKLSTGYWRIFDPNNGFTAISQEKLRSIPLEKIDNRYFFESDMLFRLHLCDVIVKDIPLPAIYKDERSNLKIKRVIFEFPLKHLRNFAKRIVYSYYLRDFNLASLELPLGIMLAGFGSILGVYSWIHGIMTSSSTATGTLILISISSLAGLQLLLAFFSYDSNNQSR